MKNQTLFQWKLIGLAATFLIVLSFPLYVSMEKNPPDFPPGAGSLQNDFAGSDKCRSCHKSEYDKWEKSDHRRAMAPATEQSVLGDFSDSEFDHFGEKSRFYRKGGKYFVYTQGPDGKMGEFKITHTFGWYPLQQYLVPFPGGRLQCLPLAWDAKGKRWYPLYPENPPDPQDWLYWTNQAQNWNGMCAECHSTNLRKNYDPQNRTFRTTWSEISVGCEACHGPGSAHVQWAQTPEMGRLSAPNFDLVVKTRDLTSHQQIQLCAPCHSRRMSLGENPHMHNDFLDYAIPQLLSEGYYFPDGQILEEVYEYGSFIQSKMADRGIRCSNCHDVHSGKRIREGNALCLTCHKQAVYDTAKHHFHKKTGEKGEPIRSKTGTILSDIGSGARCEPCHMPGRTYMGVDYRPDHSFRIPDPGLSLKLHTPNACNRCHADKTDQWSADAVARWYGLRQRPHYGTILAAGRDQKPEALTDLIRLSQDRLYSPIVRATALSLAAAYPGNDGGQAVVHALSDESSLVRYAALRYLPESTPRLYLPVVAPLLYDPVKAVRIEAASFLAGISSEEMPAAAGKRFQAVLEEYRKAMGYTADFASSRYNLGNLYSNMGKHGQAIEQYREAIRIDGGFYPAKVNLAMLYNRQGKNDQAKGLLHEVADANPELFEVSYSLGLILVEMNRYDEAVVYLKWAAKGMPDRDRVHYNLGLLLQQLNRDSEAETALSRALTLNPDHMDYLQALAQFYLRTGNLQKARPIARQMISAHPDQRIGYDLLSSIDKMGP